MRTLTLLLVLLCVAGCNCNVGPTPDSCEHPTRGTVDLLELGQAGGTAEAFTPLADDDAVPVIRGPQGGDMIGVRIRLTGSAPPECLSQRTKVVLGGSGVELIRLDSAVRTYASAGQTRVTETLWLPGDYSPTALSEVTVTSEASGQTVARRVKAFPPERCAEVNACSCSRCLRYCGINPECEPDPACDGKTTAKARGLLDSLEACLVSACGAVPDGGTLPDGGGGNLVACRGSAVQSYCSAGAPASCGKCTARQQTCLQDRQTLY